MALTVTNKLTNSILDPQLVKILQDLENKIPERSHFTPYSAILGKNKGICFLAVSDYDVSPVILGMTLSSEGKQDAIPGVGRLVFGMIACTSILITEWSTIFELHFILGDVITELGNLLGNISGYIYFCGPGVPEEPFDIRYISSSSTMSLTITHTRDQKIEFTNAFMIGTTTN